MAVSGTSSALLPFSGEAPAPQCLPCREGPKSDPRIWGTTQCSWCCAITHQMVAIQMDYPKQIKGRRCILYLDIFADWNPSEEKYFLSYHGINQEFWLQKWKCSIHSAMWGKAKLRNVIAEHISLFWCLQMALPDDSEVALIPALCWAVRTKTMCRIGAVLTIQSLAHAEEPGPFEHCVVHMLLKVSVRDIDLARLHTAWQHRPDLGKK